MDKKGWIIDTLESYGNCIIPESTVKECIELVIKMAGVDVDVHKGINGDWIADAR